MERRRRLGRDREVALSNSVGSRGGLSSALLLGRLERRLIVFATIASRSLDERLEEVTLGSEGLQAPEINPLNSNLKPQPYGRCRGASSTARSATRERHDGRETSHSRVLRLELELCAELPRGRRRARSADRAGAATPSSTAAARRARWARWRTGARSEAGTSSGSSRASCASSSGPTTGSRSSSSSTTCRRASDACSRPPTRSSRCPAAAAPSRSSSTRSREAARDLRHPIVILNQDGFYDPFFELMRRASPSASCTTSISTSGSRRLGRGDPAGDRVDRAMARERARVRDPVSRSADRGTRRVDRRARAGLPVPGSRAKRMAAGCSPTAGTSRPNGCSRPTPRVSSPGTTKTRSCGSRPIPGWCCVPRRSTSAARSPSGCAPRPIGSRSTQPSET